MGALERAAGHHRILGDAHPVLHTMAEVVVGADDRLGADQLNLAAANLQPGFALRGLGALAEAALTCDRMVQF